LLFMNPDGASLIGELDDAAFVAMRESCSQQEFVDAVASRLRAAPESIPRVMGRVNRLRSQGDISADLVRSLEAKITGGEPLDCNGGVTIELRNHMLRPPSSASRDCPPRTIEVGRVLRDRYVIEKCLGSGGKGSVYKALDRYRSGLSSSPRHVAIKILNELPGSSRDGSESLQQELHYAQMLAHQNIIKLFDIDRDGELDFLTMELLEGEMLSDLLTRFHPRPVARPHAWSIIGQIAAGIAHAHERGVVHADLKPQNIMVTSAGEVRILDFGASRSFRSRAREVTGGRLTASVTPAYACCELLDGRNPDPRDDLYALSCIAYELLSGAHPFQRRRANVARDFGVVAVRPAGLTRRQWGALSKGLCWHRAGRSISVARWFDRLKPRRREASRTADIRQWKPTPLKSRRAPAFRASAVFALLIATIGAWMLFVRLAPGGRVRGETLPALASGHLLNSATLPEPAAVATPILPAKAAQLPGVAPQRADPLSITPSDYLVQPGQHFAEIRVHRARGAHGDTPFVWWTEAASAQPGVDYVSQAKVVQNFPKGKDSTSFFVKLLPRASRSQPAVFYVAIADKSGRKADHITHSTVRLPPMRNTS
jgi:serine/threonine protein kinase